jgi:hypothetical protein
MLLILAFFILSAAPIHISFFFYISNGQFIKKAQGAPEYIDSIHRKLLTNTIKRKTHKT